MNIQFGFPEICLIAAATLLSLGFSSQFWVLLSLGVLGAIARTAINVQSKKEDAEFQKNNMDDVKKAFADLQNTLYSVPAPVDKKDYTTH